MTYKHIPQRLGSMDAERVSKETGLSVSAVLQISGTQSDPPRAVTASEAIVLGKFLDLDPKKILSTQADEELAAAGYVATKQAPEKTTVGAKQPALPSRAQPRISRSTTW